MSNRTIWTKPMLQRLQQLDRQGSTIHEITDTLFEEFGAPVNFGETGAELAFLKTSKIPLHQLLASIPLAFLFRLCPRPSVWTAAMEARVKQLHAAGADANEITNQLFSQFAKPDKW